MGDGFVDIANVLSRLCKDYGTKVPFILFVGSYFAHSIWSTFSYFKNLQKYGLFGLLYNHFPDFKAGINSPWCVYLT